MCCLYHLVSGVIFVLNAGANERKYIPTEYYVSAVCSLRTSSFSAFIVNYVINVF